MTDELRSCYRYIPEFITEEEEEYLLRKIAETPQPKWKNVTNRRLQIWGGEIANHTLLSQPLAPFLNSYPNLIERLASTGAFDNSPHKAPNHVIINEYKPGEGIMPHEDGPSYHPVVATISLGSHAVFHYLRYKPDPTNESTPESNAGPTTESTPVSDQPSAEESTPSQQGPSMGGMEGMESKGGRAIDPKLVLSLLLEPRSVIITSGTLYKDHLHGIQDVTEDRILGVEEDSTRNDMDPEDGNKKVGGVKIDNWELIKGEKEAKVVREGGVLERSTRVSLTCRDVEKVKKGIALGIGRK